MAAEMTANGQSADIAGAGSRLTISKSVSAQRLDQAGLGSRQQFRENSEVRATRGTDPQRRDGVNWYPSARSSFPSPLTSRETGELTNWSKSCQKRVSFIDSVVAEK